MKSTCSRPTPSTPCSKTLEEPPRHVVFILATTEPLKVPQTILSRCQRFDFARLGARDAADRLRYICEKEKIETTEEALHLIARKAEGSMRDALTLLDQVVATGLRPLTAPGVRDALGIAGRELFFEWTGAIQDRDPARALRSLGQAVDAGANIQELADEFLAHLRNLLLIATDPGLAELCEATEEEREIYLRQAEGLAQADLLRYTRLCLETVSQMRKSAYPRAHLEVALAEMCTLPTALDLRRFIDATRRHAAEAPPAPAGPALGPSARPPAGSSAGTFGGPSAGTSAGTSAGSSGGPATGRSGGGPVPDSPTPRSATSKTAPADPTPPRATAPASSPAGPSRATAVLTPEPPALCAGTARE